MVLKRELSRCRPSNLLQETSRSCGCVSTVEFVSTVPFSLVSMIADPFNSAWFKFTLRFGPSFVTVTSLMGDFLRVRFSVSCSLAILSELASNFYKSRFSMLQKCECCRPVSCSSSPDHAGITEIFVRAALMMEHAIRYWLVFTSLWSCKLRRDMKSTCFSMRLTSDSSYELSILLPSTKSFEKSVPCAMNTSTTSKKVGWLSNSKDTSFRMRPSYATSSLRRALNLKFESGYFPPRACMPAAAIAWSA